MSAGNKAIRDHRDEGRALRLFQGSGGSVTYLGEYRLAMGIDPVYQQTAPQLDSNKERLLWKFRLEPVNLRRTRQIKRGLVFTGAYRSPTRSRYRPPFVSRMIDMDALDRATERHHDLQDQLEHRVRKSGGQTHSPTALDPLFDLGWEKNGRSSVAEVKTLSAASEAQQLRLGLGQVLHYQHQLALAGRRTRAVLFVERQPDDTSWMDLCHGVHVTLCWPEGLGELKV